MVTMAVQQVVITALLWVTPGPLAAVCGRIEYTAAGAEAKRNPVRKRR
jgi:hypothetical protein